MPFNCSTLNPTISYDVDDDDNDVFFYYVFVINIYKYVGTTTTMHNERIFANTHTYTSDSNSRTPLNVIHTKYNALEFIPFGEYVLNEKKKTFIFRLHSIQI